MLLKQVAERLRPSVEEYTRMLLAAEPAIERATHSALARALAGFGRRCVPYRANASPKQRADVMLSFVAQATHFQSKTRRAKR
jgi:hypothetical protein